jgi:hypothetical protein
MKLNYMQCWNGAMAIFRDHKEAILAIAGVFLFLPTLLMAQFVGQPVLEGLTDFNDIAAAYSVYFNENALVVILSNLLMSYGGFVIFITIAPSHSGTVAGDLGKGFRLFLIFLVANILTGIVTGLGLLLFIIPGIYAACRLVLAPLIIADQNERNPLEALKKSWAHTKSNGFAILFLILIIAIVGSIAVSVFEMIIGLIIGLATGGQGWALIENFVAAIGGTILQIVFATIIASIYIQLSGKRSDVEQAFS